MERLSSHGEMLSRVELENLPHSSFDLGKHNFLSGKLGKIIPARISEVYPGDTLKGRTQVVANFEPLAGSICGTMVTKQESFYIAKHYVWRNSYKFFTGKNGFDTHEPTVSPQTVYDTYKTILKLPNIQDLFNKFQSYYLADDVENRNSVKSFILEANAVFHTAIIGFGNRFMVLDLLQYLLDRYNYYFIDQQFDEDGNFLGSRSDIAFEYDITNTATTWLDLLRDFYSEVYNYLFGASSMLDYMGWPCLPDWHDFFKALVFYATQPVGSEIELPDGYLNVFSQIPLAWLPFRAAYLVWYWNYRDQLLETAALDPEDDSFTADTADSTQIILCTLLRVRCWYKDTFTTALTNTGSGNFGVPVDTGEFGASSREITYYDNLGNLLANTSDYEAAIDNGAAVAKISSGGIEYEIPMNYLHGASDFAAGGFSSNDSGYMLSLELFDRVSRLRRFTRKQLILGYEYDDVLWSSFRVRLSNYRMNIPELLDRGRDVVAINTIVNNTTTAEQVAGDKTAVAWSNGNTDGVNYFVEEHGYFMHFITVMPIPTYVGGLQRLYLKKERFDMMWPEFATMGMDAIYNAELCAPMGSGVASGLSDEGALTVFGYQGRYYDLKGEHDEAHGRFRTDLNYMLFTRQFDAKHPPKLNYISVHCWPRLDMFVVADESVDVIRTMDVYTNIDGFRTLPVESERV